MKRPSSRRVAGTGSVRIIGGHWRGSKLPVPALPGLRPTADRARETLFNWLQPQLPGARVLDLFAGSGALGLEAASRGAAEVVLLERHPTAVASLRDAVARLHGQDRVQVIAADALHWLQTAPPARFDIVFLDPPYADALWSPVVAALPPWLDDSGWVYVESAAASPFVPPVDWQPHRQSATRDAHHALYRRAAAATLV